MSVLGAAVRRPPNQITQWKGQLLEGAAGVFGQDKSEAGRLRASI